MNYSLIAYLVIFTGICLFWVFVINKPDSKKEDDNG